MNTAWIRRARSVAALLFGAAMMTAFFACSEDGLAPPPAEDASSPPPFGLPEASPEDASTAPDAAASDPDAARCTDSGFCMASLPTLQPLVSVAATSGNDAWAITREEILRWDGDSWTGVYRSSGGDLIAMVVPHPNDVWVVGSRSVIRYSARDGQPPSFREYRDSIDADPWTTTGMWVSPDSSELWVQKESWWAGRQTLYRYREGGGDADSAIIGEDMMSATMGFPWPTVSESFEGYSVFGFAPDDVYIGGLWCSNANCERYSDAPRYGAIAHYDGRRWVLVSQLGKDERVSAIFGTVLPDQSRQLWIWVGEGGPDASTIRLLPSKRDGTLGAAQHTLPMPTNGASFSTLDSHRKGCHRVQSTIIDPSTAWFTNGCLAYRWNGSALEHVRTLLGDLPMGSVTGIAAGSEDVWLVGAAPSKTRGEVIGFAARKKGAP